MALHRRRFLQISGALGVLVSVPSVAMLALRGSAPLVDGLQVLSDHHHRTFQAMAATHIPKGGAFALGAADFDLARLFDGYLADQPGSDQREVKIALNLLEFGPVLFERHAATFSNLEPAAQLAHWTAWSTSELAVRREIFWSFGKFVGLAFYDQAQVWPSLGYKGPSYLRMGLPP